MWNCFIYVGYPKDTHAAHTLLSWSWFSPLTAAQNRNVYFTHLVIVQLKCCHVTEKSYISEYELTIKNNLGIRYVAYRS